MNQHQDAEKKIRIQFEQVLKNLDYFKKAIRHFLAEQKLRKISVPARAEDTEAPKEEQSKEVVPHVPHMARSKTLDEALIENARLKQENESLKKIVGSLQSLKKEKTT
ncbi:MAG: hypothetical protein ABIH77_04880 [Pseudomonadota bacterium]|nr:hypothetical protein [Gammaproteobacteria bacterium]MBU1558749.1 hypothetical protein [Gammaproteobacteria bacterium]MBU1629131.1 hypothetical protein [Gammaproteobacteria bacterium]MBU1926646.1 hypothetical protein [Gammaproteobacteria bacterium]MBU2546648.1 hypothetical protein [Gammaproteobacteria bacterium]